VIARIIKVESKNRIRLEPNLITVLLYTLHFDQLFRQTMICRTKQRLVLKKSNENDSKYHNNSIKIIETHLPTRVR
jgi:hypothetical protein